MSKSSIKGFTIIEVLVALFFLITITFAVIQLVTRASQVAQRAQEGFVAANIAREGVELIRARRDTQWFTDADRSNWIPSQMCDSPFTFDAISLRNRYGVTVGGAGDLYIASNGEWSHTPSDTTTPYKRVLEVDCSEKDGDPGFVTTTSRVTWVSRGESREVVLKEKLYNWLP